MRSVGSKWCPRVTTWSPKSPKICKKCRQKLVPKAHYPKTPFYNHSNYENMTPVQAGALFSLWHPTSKKSQNRSKMDTKTDPKSHKPPLGHHSQITLCTAHPNCTKIFKNDVQKGPQNDVKIHSKTSQKRTRHPLGPRWLPKVAPDPPKPRFLAPKPRF